MWSLPTGQKFSQFDKVEYNNIQYFLLYRAAGKLVYGLTSDESLITRQNESLITRQNNTYMAIGELELFDYSWAMLSYDG